MQPSSWSQQERPAVHLVAPKKSSDRVASFNDLAYRRKTLNAHGLLICRNHRPGLSARPGEVHCALSEWVAIRQRNKG